MVNVERKDEETNLLFHLLAKAAPDTIDMVADAGLGLDLYKGNIPINMIGLSTRLRIGSKHEKKFHSPYIN